MIRTELLVVEMSQAAGLPLRGQLSGDATVAQGVGKLSSMIASGQASLVGTATTWSLSGERSVSEAVEEIRYQTDFNPSNCFGFPAPSELDILFDTIFLPPLIIDAPTSFETRNTGVTLELEAMASNEGRKIDLQLVAQHVRFLGMRPTFVVNRADSRLAAPIFRTHKIVTSIETVSGVWKLVAFDVMKGKEPRVEFMLIRATTFPTD